MLRRSFSFVLNARSHPAGSYNRSIPVAKWRRAAFLLLPRPSRIGCHLYVATDKRTLAQVRDEGKDILASITYGSGWPNLGGNWLPYDEIEEDFYFSEVGPNREVMWVLEGGVLSYLKEKRLFRLGPTLHVSSRALPYLISDTHLAEVKEAISTLPKDRKDRREFVLH